MAADTASIASKALLSPRDRHILTLACQGQWNGRMAATLGIKQRTVRKHVNRIYDRLDVGGRFQLITYALRHNLVGRPEVLHDAEAEATRLFARTYGLVGLMDPHMTGATSGDQVA